MHERALGNVREGLLRAGIVPRHVDRYVLELGDHMAELVARERAAGLDAHAAEAKARVLLGTDAQLVQAMIDSGAPRSLAARAPWAILGIAPVVVLVASMILLGAGSMAILAPYAELSGSAVPAHVHVIGLAITLLGSYVIAPALAAACIAIALRQRLSSRWVWTGLALIALASGPLGIHIDFPQLESGLPGGIRGSLIQTVHAAGRVDFQATLLVMSLRAFALLALSTLVLRLSRQRTDTEVA